jgi:hypothetical protein
MVNSRLHKNRDKSVKSLVRKDAILTIVELVLVKIQRGDIPLGPFLEGAKGLGFRIKLSDLMSEEDLAETLTLEEDVKQMLIDTILGSRMFKEFVAEILVAALRKIILRDNIFTQKVPVLGPLAKFGQRMANMTLDTLGSYSEWPDNFEVELKALIRNNAHLLDSTIGGILHSLLAPNNVAKIAHFVWEHLHDQAISVDSGILEKISIDLTVAIPNLLDGLIDSLYEKVGDLTLKDVI